MVTALFALCVVLGLGVALLIVEVWGLPRRRRRAIVNLASEDGALEGLLWSRRGAWLVLKDARLLRPNGEALVIDGETLIDKARVVFIQVL